MTADLGDLYQELILDHNRRPRHRGRLEAPDHTAEGFNPLCGDRVTIDVRMTGDRVDEIRFDGGGCAISTASASIMSETVRGRSMDEVRRLFEDFHGMLTGDASAAEVPGKLRAFAGVKRFPARVKCATLAWHTLAAALEDWHDPVTTE